MQALEYSGRSSFGRNSTILNLWWRQLSNSNFLIRFMYLL